MHIFTFFLFVIFLQTSINIEVNRLCTHTHTHIQINFSRTNEQPDEISRSGPFDTNLISVIE